MAGMSDEIEVLIVPNLKTSGVEKQTKEIADMFENNIGKPLDASLERYFKKINGQLVAFVKTGNKYKRLALDVDKKKNITGVSGLSGSYSKAEAQKLLKQEVRQEEVREKELEAVRKKREKNKNEKQLRERAKQFSELIGQSLSGKDKIRFDISQNEDYLKTLEKEFQTVGKRSKRFKELQTEIRETQKAINSLKKDLQKEIKVSGIQKLINTFKRVGFYRLARRLFQVIEQGLSESITNLAKFDSGVNDTMSSLTSSFTVLSNSLGVVITPLLKVVEPILNGLAKTVGSVANAIGYLLAKLTGSSKLLKVNTDYLKDFNKEVKALSFDKFESLDESADIGSMFEEVDLESTSFLGELAGAKEELAKIDELLITIGGTLAGYASYKFVDWIVSGKAKTFFADADTGLGKIKKKIDDISSAGLIASSAFAFVTSIINLIDVIKNWDSQSLVTKITAIVSVCLALFAVIASILSAVLPTGSAKVFKAIAIGTTAGATLTGVVSAMRFAEGGRPESGSLFIAGESGAELVTTMPSGQTGVTNIAQFRQATVEALYEWWSDAKYDIPEGSTTYLDGAQIARSKSFKNELNRTNSGLNLR